MNPEIQVQFTGSSSESGTQVSSHATSRRSRSRENSNSPQPFDHMDLVHPPEMPAESDHLEDIDCDEHIRERETLYQDLASDNQDFTRSDEEGWFYSDED